MPPNRPPRTSTGPSWWLIVLIAALIVAGLYYWLRETTMNAPAPMPPPASSTAPADGAPQVGAPEVRQSAEAPAPAGADESKSGEQAETQSQAEAPPADQPRYPLPSGVAKADDPSLPALDRSDPPILDSALELAPRNVLAQFLNLQDFTRRFVVTIDNLPRKVVPTQYSVVRHVPGAVVIGSEEGQTILLPGNYKRYDAFVGFVTSLDPKTMVAIYSRFYPLLQQEYRAMGFPKGEFNDRVIDAIDNMLAAPEVTGPIRLVQPRVLYRFEDPKLEALSAGQKLMIRVGPENAAKLKAVLRAIRAQLLA